MATLLRLAFILLLAFTAAAQGRLRSKFIGSATNQETVGYPTNWPIESVSVGTDTSTPVGWNTNWTQSELNAHLASLESIVAPLRVSYRALLQSLDDSNKLYYSQEQVIYRNMLTNVNLIPVGNSASNKVMVGRAYASSESYTNLNGTGTLTNLGSCTIPSLSFARKNDTIKVAASIKLANATANTNQFQLVYGGQIPLDTGMQTASNTIVYIEATIIRTGPATERCYGTLSWGPGSATAVPYAFTNFSMELSQANNVDNVLAIRGAARRGGAHTNDIFEVWHTSVQQ